MEIKKPKVVWTIVILTVVGACIIGSKIAGDDTENPSDSTGYLGGIITLVIIAVVLVFFWSMKGGKK